MGDPPHERQSGKHLSDVDIGKILGLAKALIPQRQITSLMKCGQATVQHVLTKYVFETFQGHGPQRDYKRKTTKREDRYIEHALKQNHSAPLQEITNIIALPISERTVHLLKDCVQLKNNL